MAAEHATTDPNSTAADHLANSQRTSGLHRFLSTPALYSLFQIAVGSRRARVEITRRHIRPRGGDRVLDIGCGPGDYLTFLPAVTYVGFDESARYIETARRRFRDRSPAPSFFCERVSRASLGEPNSFDIALAMGVLHHLDDSEARDLLHLAHAALRPGGRLVTIDPCVGEGQSSLARYIVLRDRGQHVRGRGACEALASRVFASTSSYVRHDLLRIPYTLLVLECSKG